MSPIGSRKKSLIYLSLSSVALALSACGGGGGGGGSDNGNIAEEPAGPLVSGTVASGAPVAGAKITVVGANGQTKTATADANGNYAVSLGQLTAPLVFKAQGRVADGTEVYVSVHPTAEATNVNITPLTNAIAATLASTGKPIDLFNNISTEKGSITPEKIAASESAVRGTLQNLMTALGVSTDFNLINGVFSANGTGFDRVLDNITVNVNPSGKITLASIPAVKGDDLGETVGVGVDPALTDVPKPIIFSKGQSIAGQFLSADGELVDTTILDGAGGVRESLNACFAVPAPRITGTTLVAECAWLNDPAYLNDGDNLVEEFRDYLTDSGMDNATFNRPEVLRQLPGKARVKLTALRASGGVASLITVVEKDGANWVLRGNGRQFDVRINAAAQRRTALNKVAAATGDEFDSLRTGIHMFIRPNPAIKSAVVTGPGMPDATATTPAGVNLFPTAHCGFLSIGPAGGPGINNCSSIFALSGQYTQNAAHPFPVTFPAGTLANVLRPALPEASIEQIWPFSIYKVVITKTDNTKVTYYERLRSRPALLKELNDIQFVDVASTTQDRLKKGATLFTGGATFPVEWSAPALGLRPNSIFIALSGLHLSTISVNPSIGRLGAPVAGFADVACDSDCPGNVFPSFSGYPSRVVQLTAKDRFDARISSQYFWDN
ncbi:MAG: carboxypeptidase-like regulatory domain-containing protein [Pseudomonadota bacterium]